MSGIPSAMDATIPAEAETLKGCCAAIYEHEAAKLLVGDSLHPGGLQLTERLGKLLGLHAGSKVLDVASGQGASAFFLAERFGCQVTGIDFGEDMVAGANRRAAEKGLADQVQFRRADAEHLPFADGTFDVVLCECAFCLFPDKASAAGEFARVLVADGKVGLSDLTRKGALPESMNTLMSWIACVADARPVEDYVRFLEEAGLHIEVAEAHDDKLVDLIETIQLRLLGADVLVGLGKLDLQKDDLATARNFASEARAATLRGKLGYSLVVAGRRS